MIDNNLVHLHVHSEYSLLDGMSRIKNIVEKAKKLNMKAVAITDHGTMYGVVEFYKQAVKAGIKPIIGCELYLASRSRFKTDSVIDRKRFHITMLAKSQKGYVNLMKLSSLGFTEGFYYKPRIDDELLERYAEGLICLSGCISGDIAQYILAGNIDKAEERARFYKKIYRENFYLELQNHGLREEKIVNSELMNFSRELDIPIVATNDVHYINKEDAKYHDILLCIGTQKKLKEDRLKFPSDEYFFKSYDEMKILFPEESIVNSERIAAECNVSLDFKTKHLPEFTLPEGIDKYDYFKKICIDGMLKRIPSADKKEYDRLNYEIEVINRMGYIDYFLIVGDFIEYAKKNKIPVGPGRGSSAGSLVAYAMNITDVNPIKYNLIFERFLNPERVSMPDIDVDFGDERREEVIEYVLEKYGKERVAQIITFGTLAAKAVIRDVGRALDISNSKVDMVAKKIPPMSKITIREVLDSDVSFKKIYQQDFEIKEMLDIAMNLEGLPRHASLHAAGVLISKSDVMNYVPLAKNKDMITTQFNMNELEELGLLKMDFLALRNLTVIDKAKKEIKNKYGKNINFDEIGYEDKEVYKMFSAGKTMGVFQFESSGMISFIKELKPSKFDDIACANALYRPGPMKQIPIYIKNAKNPASIKYKDELIRPALEETYGCMVYQEQVMQIVRDIAGFSWGRSDLLRRAMSKKKMKVMLAEKEHFISGAIDKGVSKKIAEELFDLITEFANYAFPKGHSVAYGMVAYQTAYLKAHYPLEYMAALISSVCSSTNYVSKYIRECDRLKIKLMAPDINYSEGDFISMDDKICFGLRAVKNVGSNVISNIVAERDKNGKYKSFTDFCTRVDMKNLSKRQVESLIKCGAFDSLGYKRSALTLVYENIIDSVSLVKRNYVSGQVSLLDSINSDDNGFNANEEIPNIEEFPNEVLLEMERDILGIYISGHPLDKYSEVIEEYANTNTGEIHELLEIGNSEMDKNYLHNKSNVVLGGIILSKKKKITKNGKAMAFFTIEDFYGIINCIIFPNNYNRFSEDIENGRLILLQGELDLSDENNPQIIVSKIKPLKIIDNRKVYVRFENIAEYKAKKQDLFDTLNMAKGNHKVIVYCSEEKAKMVLSDEKRVNIDNEFLIKKLNDDFCQDNIKIK